MDDGALARHLLDAAARAGADGADVIVARDATLSIGVADGALEEVERAESREAGLRVLVGPRQACVASSDLSPGALEEMAARAVAMAAAAPEDPTCGLPAPDQTGGHADPAGLRLIDPESAPTPEELEDAARAAEAGPAPSRGHEGGAGARELVALCPDPRRLQRVHRDLWPDEQRGRRLGHRRGGAVARAGLLGRVPPPPVRPAGSGGDRCQVRPACGRGAEPQAPAGRRLPGPVRRAVLQQPDRPPDLGHQRQRGRPRVELAARGDGGGRAPEGTRPDRGPAGRGRGRLPPLRCGGDRGPLPDHWWPAGCCRAGCWTARPPASWTCRRPATRGAA